MATVRDTAAPAGLNVTAATGTLPVTGLSVAPGSKVIVACGSERGALDDIKTPTCTDGVFTEVGTGLSGPSGLFLRVYQRIITSTTSTNFTVTTTNSTAASTQKSVQALAIVVDGAATALGDVQSSLTVDAPSVTPTNATGDVLVIFSAHETPDTEITPAGMTAIGSSGEAALGESVGFYQVLTSGAATGVRATKAAGNSGVTYSLIVPNQSSATAHSRTITDVAGAVDTATGNETYTRAFTDAADVSDMAGLSASSLTDDFAAKDLTKWVYDQTADVVGGQLVLACNVTYGDQINSVSAYSLTGSMVSAEFVSPPAVGNGTTEMFLQVMTTFRDNSYALSWLITGGAIVVKYIVGGAQTIPVSVPYDPAQHRFLRLREAGGTVYWDSSPNGTTWTNQYQLANPFALSQLFVQLATGHYGDETAPGTAVFDNVNIVPGAGFENRTITDSATASDSVTAAQQHARAIADPAGATDTVAWLAGAARAVTDAAGAADSTAAAASSVRAVADTAGATDTASSASTASRPLLDAVGAVDAASTGQARTQALTDSLGAVDTATTTRDLATTVTDSATAVDATTQVGVSERTLLEQSGAVDIVQVSGTGTNQLTDTATATDSVTQASSSAQPFTDTAGAVDSVAVGIAVTITDAISAFDPRYAPFGTAPFGTAPFGGGAASANPVATIGTTVVLVDTATVVDAGTYTVPSVRAVTDAATVVDTVAAAVAVTQTITDTVDTVDAIDPVGIDTAVIVADTVPAGDSLAVTASTPEDVVLELTDHVDATDAISPVTSGGIFVELHDTVGIADTASTDLLAGIYITLHDTAGAADTVTRTASVTRAVTDNAAVVDVTFGGTVDWVYAINLRYGPGLIATGPQAGSGLLATPVRTPGLTATRA